MKTRKILLQTSSLLLGVALLTPMFAYAAATTTPTISAAKLQSAITKANTEIDRRTTALNDLATRINATQRVTAQFKQTLATNVQNQINGLATLKAKIDADTDVTTLRADIQTIAQSYRIYMLVMPQARIATAADREITVITMMNQLGAKLQARLSSAQSAGSDVSTLLAALTDMSQKVTDASTQAQAAVSVSSALAPDGGDATKMAANASALKTARGDIGASQKDLVAARQDVDTIIKGLKSLPPPTSASTTPTTTP